MDGRHFFWYSIFMSSYEYTVERPNPMLAGRTRRIYNWLREGQDVLDAGCSSGYGTFFFEKKSKSIHAIDPNEGDIANAKKTFSGITFQTGYLEDLPYEAEVFDTVIMADVLEHVKDEVQVLNEIHRTLREQGSIIITVPYTGIFSFLDPENYTVFLREYMPTLYKRIYRLVKRKDPKPVEVGMESWHRHYTYSQIISFFEKSAFANNYEIERRLRSGFVLMPLAANIRYFSNFILPKRLASIIQWPFTMLSRMEYYMPTGPLAWSIALQVRKK